MMVKKNAEMEKKKEEERERKKKLERERMERVKAYKEPEWATVNDEDVEEIDLFDDEQEKENKKGNGAKELYCVVCGKKFKSEKQWKNHEQSKKHKEKVAELRESFGSEDEEEEYFEGGEEENDEVSNVYEVEERFKEGVSIIEEENGAVNPELSEDKDGFFDVEDVHEVDGSNVEDANGDEDEIEDGDGEMSVLEAMVIGHKSQKSRKSKHMNADFPTEIHVDGVNDEPEVMEYNNRKSRRRKGKKDRRKNNGGVPAKEDFDEKSPDDEMNGHDNKQTEESPSHSFVENENDDDNNDHSRKSHKNDQSVESKGATKKESNTKLKNSSKGKKGKATSKSFGNAREKCGEEFESRTKLHKHLNDTGHASLKFR